MDSYNTIINSEMIRNILQTNMKESLELFNIKLLLYLGFLGIIPSFIIYKLKIIYPSFKRAIFLKIKYTTATLLLIAAIFFLFSKHYTSFFREHKPLRYSINPHFWLYSIGKYINTLTITPTSLKAIGLDAKIIEEEEEEKPHNELVIFVLGETARSDHFSLNGYKKKTNPLLEKEDIISFKNLSSCGTSTAFSVPCIFSFYDRKNFSYKKAKTTYNILDILNYTNKIEILWRDNNSDSKGVALRVKYEDFKSPKNNPICFEGECRDEGMLVGLEKFIKEHPNKDIFIVLHQIGSHGPAYYKRYPKEFEKFTPVCKTNQLQECSKEEIINSYDNTILYTDYFLSKVINFLKKYEKQHYQTAMLYVSDHGESLGENGIYLHGLPYFIAPKAQKSVAALLWLGENIKEDINYRLVKAKENQKLSHDSIFHTLLGLFEVQTKLYKKEEDILR